MLRKTSFFLSLLIFLSFVFSPLCFSQSDSVVATIWLPDELGGVSTPRVFTYNSINNKIYVCGGERVVVIDGGTNQRVAGITVGKNPCALTYNSTNNKIYCANNDGSSISVIGCSPPSAVEGDQEIQVIPSFSLKQNYPNPFNPSTTIHFTVHGSQFTVSSPLPTSLKIYNILGQKVRSLVDEPTGRGSHEVIWDGKDDKGKELASGIYFYRLKVGKFSECKKMLLLK